MISGFAGNVGGWDVAIFAIYILASLALGLVAGGKRQDLKTYLLAGHQMSPLVISISIMAALISGISFLGAPAESYGHDLTYFAGSLGYLIATPITTLIFLPFFFRQNVYTAYEYLERRFDLRLRRLSSAAFIFRVTLWLSLAIYAPSLVISEMTGVPFWMAVVFTGGATLLYTVIGGMKAVIYTDVMQFLVLVLGLAAIFWVAVSHTEGGLSGAWQIAEAGGRTRFFDLDFSLTSRVTFWGALIGGVFIQLVSLVTDQVSVQRYLTATSLKESQKALWMKLIFMLPIMALFYLTGTVLYAFYQTHPEMAASLVGADHVIPHFISRQLPSPLPGLLIAAILAATMSTVSAGVNSLTTATLMDFLYVDDEAAKAEAEENRRVRVARAWTIGYGVLTSVIALGIGRLGTLIEATNKIAGLFGGPLLGIFLLGAFSSRANSQGTLIGASGGFFFTLAVGLGTSVSFMWYAMIGCLTTYAFSEIASRFFRKPSEHQRSFSLRPIR